jgi:hypothetical protein
MITTKVDSVYEVRRRTTQRATRERPTRCVLTRPCDTCHTLGGQVELPPAVKRLLSLFAIVISFGLNGISSVLECLGMRGYVSTLAFHTAAPLFLALLVLLAALGRMLNMRRFTAEALLETAVPALLKLAFLAYPLVATVAFRKRRALKRSQCYTSPSPRFHHPSVHDRLRLSTQMPSRATRSLTASGSRRT